MLKVRPSISQFQEDSTFSLDAVTTFSMENTGTFDVAYSFGDGWATLKASMSKTFDTYGTAYTKDSMLYFRFIEPEVVSNGDYRGLIITCGRLTDESKMNASITGGR